MIRYQTFFSVLADVLGSETADEILLVTAAGFCRKIFRALHDVRSQKQAGSCEEHLNCLRGEGGLAGRANVTAGWTRASETASLATEPGWAVLLPLFRHRPAEAPPTSFSPP